jgi:chemotaxis response regulator CheB
MATHATDSSDPEPRQTLTADLNEGYVVCIGASAGGLDALE